MQADRTLECIKLILALNSCNSCFETSPLLCTFSAAGRKIIKNGHICEFSFFLGQNISIALWRAKITILKGFVTPFPFSKERQNKSVGTKEKGMESDQLIKNKIVLNVA